MPRQLGAYNNEEPARGRNNSSQVTVDSNDPTPARKTNMHMQAKDKIRVDNWWNE